MLDGGGATACVACRAESTRCHKRCTLPTTGHRPPPPPPSARAGEIRGLLRAAVPPGALPSCFKPQAAGGGASVISPASTPSCLSAASSIDNLAGPLNELSASGGASGVADGATGSDRKEGECE